MSMLRATNGIILTTRNDQTDVKHSKQSFQDGLGSSPGQQSPSTSVYQTRGLLQSMDALWGLVSWLPDRQPTKPGVYR